MPHASTRPTLLQADEAGARREAESVYARRTTMANLELTRLKDPAPHRRIAIGTWRATGDPSAYGTIELRLDAALRYLGELGRRTGRRVGLLHLLAKAAGLALAECPGANALLRGGRVHLRRQVSVHLRSPGEPDAAGGAATSPVEHLGAVLGDAGRRSLVELFDDFQGRAARLSPEPDAAPRGLLRWIPQALVTLWVRLASFVAFALNLDSTRLGLPPDPFGSVLVTSADWMGLESAHLPLVPHARTPLVLVLGAPRDAVVVEGGTLVQAKVATLGVTFDHRLIDGAYTAVLARVLKAAFADPQAHFGDPARPVPPPRPRPARPAAASPLAVPPTGGLG